MIRKFFVTLSILILTVLSNGNITNDGDYASSITGPKDHCD
jgi:hypothetical protein